jgi:hypothetical protein
MCAEKQPLLLGDAIVLKRASCFRYSVSVSRTNGSGMSLISPVQEDGAEVLPACHRPAAERAAAEVIPERHLLWNGIHGATSGWLTQLTGIRRNSCSISRCHGKYGNTPHQ